MADISLKRFVDINIYPHAQSVVNSTRNTVVLFTYEGNSKSPVLITSLEDAVDNGFTSGTDTYQYLQVFFNNNGVQAQVYGQTAYSAITVDMIKNLSNDLIYIAAVCEDSDIDMCYTALKTLAQSLNSDSTIYGINEKIILARTNNSSPADEDLVSHFAVKYSNTIGAEMTIAAYLSQIDVYTVDSIKDYAFTEETLAEETLTDTVFGSLQDNNVNVDIYLANAVRNCGGNCKDGSDLVNEFVRIILQQTLTDKLISLLAEKIKSTTGTSKMYSVIAQELEKYKDSGYLTTDKVWTDRPWLVKDSYNNVYTVVNTGDALLNGYVVKILPMSSLSDEDRAAHLAPKIYIVIADQYSIRKIELTGEVI